MHRYPIGFDLVVNRFFILDVPIRPRSGGFLPFLAALPLIDPIAGKDWNRPKLGPTAHIKKATNN